MSQNQPSQNQPAFEIVDFEEIQSVNCPCGTSKRALMESKFPGSIHITQISEDAQVHYHKKLTETYFFLDCDQDAKLQLNNEVVSVKQGMCVVIHPETRHRAIGKMTILNIVFPKFDETDEWFD